MLVELVLGSREGADAAFFATTVVTRPGVAAGDENDALARGFFSPEAPAGDVRSASFSWSASWTAKARSFRTARALSPAWSFQDSPATHRNRRRRTARSTDSYGPGAPRLCSAWHSATTPSTRVKSSSTSRAFSPARVALSRIASRRHRSGTFTSEASEDALRSRSVRLRAARARFSSASSASSPC